MENPSTPPRRPSLATIVGSGLAVVAAGSLLAFSSLAEQAGLQGLSTGGLRPTQPERSGRPQAITVAPPATAPPGGSRDAVDELVRRVVERDEPAPIRVRVAVAPPDPVRPTPARPTPPRRVDRARVATAAGPRVENEAGTPDWDGPPYGHAYGYYKQRGERAEPARNRDQKPKRARDAAPLHARTTGPGAKQPRPPKAKKVEKSVGNGNGKAKGHAKHGDGPGKGNGKAKGHAKHGHAQGKGKGHSKHGH